MSDELDAVEAIAAMQTMAKLSRIYFKSLIDEGWSATEAFRLTLAWQTAVAGGRPS